MVPDNVYTSLTAPRSAFLQGPPGDSAALRAWARVHDGDCVVSNGAIAAEGLQFVAWMCMTPTTHTLRVAHPALGATA